MSSPQPRIVVLISSYNAEHTIGRTIASLNANAEPHDIVIVDDGSRKPLQDFVTPQDNLTILRLDQNVGLTRAANYGLRYVLDRGYEFVARLDADDAAMPDRLALQRAFMDEHPEIALAGGWGEVVSEQGETLFHLNHPTDHKSIVKALYYNNCFLQPSIIIRAKTLREFGLYSEEFPTNAEDYELVLRVSRRAQVANIPRYLIKYTMSPGGLSFGRRREQLKFRLKAQWKYRNFSTIHFYIGILKTLILRQMPLGWITAIKKRRQEYRKQ